MPVLVETAAIGKSVMFIDRLGECHDALVTEVLSIGENISPRVNIVYVSVNNKQLVHENDVDHWTVVRSNPCWEWPPVE